MDFNFFLERSAGNRSKEEYSVMKYGDILIECYNYKNKYTATPVLIIKLLEIIPSTYLNKLQEIIYEPMLYNPEIVKGAGFIYNCGTYDPKDKRILIGDVTDYENLKETFYHELGHHIQFTGIGDYDHDKWMSLSCQSVKYISDYSKVSIFEDFAETFANYLTRPEKLRTETADKFNFIDNLFPKTLLRKVADKSRGWTA